MSGARRGVLGILHFELADALPGWLSAPVNGGRGLRVRKRGGLAAREARNKVCEHTGRIYSWSAFPLWYKRLLYACIVIGVVGGIWGVTVEFIAGAYWYGCVDALLLSAQLGIGLKLHVWERQEFKRWRLVSAKKSAKTGTDNNNKTGTDKNLRVLHNNSSNKDVAAQWAKESVQIEMGASQSQISNDRKHGGAAASTPQGKGKSSMKHSSAEENLPAEALRTPSSSKPSSWCCRNLWLVLLIATVLAVAAGAILMALVMVFLKPLAAEGASSSLVVWPQIVSHNTTAIFASAVDGMTLSVLLYAMHVGVVYWAAKQGDLPPRIGWVMVCYDILFNGCVLGWMVWGGRPHGMETMAYGQGAILIINAHFRGEIRALRMWGMSADDNSDLVAQDFRLHKTLALSMMPCLYLVLLYIVPVVVPALLAGSFSHPENSHLGTSSFARYGAILFSFRSNSSMWSEHQDGLKAALADAPGALRAWYSNVLPLPGLVFGMIGAAFSSLGTQFFLIKAADKSPRADHPIFMQPYTQVMYWTGIFVVVAEQLLAGACLGPLGTSLLLLVFGTAYQNFIAGIIGDSTAHMTDVTTFEPELLQLPLAVTAAWLQFVCMLPLELGSWDFWLFLTLGKLGFSLALDTVPWAEMRSVKRKPERRPDIFYMNFPFEGVRATCVANQLAELSVAVFALAPLVPIYLLGEESDIGWMLCPSQTFPTDMGMLVLKIVVFFIITTCSNALQFWLCGLSFRHFTTWKRFGQRAEHEPSQLRDASEIIDELIAGKRGGVLKTVQIITIYTCVIPYYLLRDTLIPVSCNGNVPMTPNMGDIMFFRARPLSIGNATASQVC